jgi:hypothetical protein
MEDHPGKPYNNKVYGSALVEKLVTLVLGWPYLIRARGSASGL